MDSGLFAADNPGAYVSGGPTASYNVQAAIAGTTRPDLYRSQRYASNRGAFTYTFPLPAGAYVVTLHWAETWSGGATPGGRVFNVAVGGVTVEAGLDIFVAAGGANTALVRSYPAVVEEGVTDLAVTFSSVVQNAMISAIEVHHRDGTAGDGPEEAPDTEEGGEEPSAVVPLATLRLNAGGPAVAGYIPDTPYVTNGAATRTWSSATSVVTTAPDAAPAAIYATQRWGKELAYTFPVPAGTYNLRLHFAELYDPVAVVGGRVFSITAAGGARP
ncbi:hypothetical protein MMPV_009618 [Pyropia vietnamensis]